MSIVVLRALGIGDLATAVPALRGLRAAFPTAPLALAAPAWLAPMAELTGAVDRLIPLSGLAALPRGVAPPAIAVNLHGSGPQSHRLLASLKPQRMLAYRTEEYPDGPQWNEQEHEVLRWCRLLAWYGIEAQPGDLALRPPAARAPMHDVAVVHPGSKSPQRRWPAHRFAEVARRLAAEGQHVVITGSAEERDLALSVCRGAGLPEDRALAGQTDVGGMAALVSAARLVVCGDTGMAHLATGYGVPSVVLFGPVPPSRWGPPANRPQHRALWRPAAHGPALLEINVPEVLAAASEVLSVRPDRSAAVRAVSPRSG
ncbi:glycosyltransferase family 9 protein [Rugosimonospora acidiphila]|uniref:Glycosyltransferase family 9 protein n=1 Tax=Rugosimonospora acidiphila TaxID=556531 RepID=A0ABP9RQJ0_9ACTN